MAKEVHKAKETKDIAIVKAKDKVKAKDTAVVIILVEI
jgi:hypothetical protein